MKTLHKAQLSNLSSLNNSQFGESSVGEGSGQQYVHVLNTPNLPASTNSRANSVTNLQIITGANGITKVVSPEKKEVKNSYKSMVGGFLVKLLVSRVFSFYFNFLRFSVFDYKTLFP